MKKLIISILFITLTINCIHTTEELIKRTIILLPFYNQSKSEDYNYLSNVIRDAIRVELTQKEIFNFIEYPVIDNYINQDQYIINNNFEEKKVLSISIKLKADIVIFCKYIIKDKEEILIELNAIDVLTDYKVVEMIDTGKLGADLFKLVDKVSQNIASIMSEKLTLIRRSYYERKLKEQEERINKELDFEESNKVFYKKYIITIGAGFVPFLYEYKAGLEVQDKNNNLLSCKIGSVNFFRFGLNIPFSFSYYFHEYNSIGFTFKIGYCFGAADFFNMNSDEMFNNSNGLLINLLVKHRIGKFNAIIKFLLEYGLWCELDGFFKKDPYIERSASSEMIRYYDGFFLGIGPALFIGLDINKGYFSYETSLFVACSFGFASKDDYLLDVSLTNYNYFIIGLEMRVNFYYPIRLKS